VLNRFRLLTRQRWVRLSVSVIGALLLVWALLWLLGPPLIRSQLERIGSEQLGRRVTVGHVDIRPWSLELSLHDVVVATEDAQAEQLAIGRLYIDAELQSIWRRAPVVDAVAADDVRVRIRRTGDGHYDIDDIVRRRASALPSGAPSESARFALYNIALHRGSVEFDDQTVGRVHRLEQLDLTIPFLSNLPAYREIKVAPRLAFQLNGSAFESDALSTPFSDDRSTEAHLQFAGFDLAPFVTYLPEGLPAKLVSGKLDADLRLEFSQAATALVKLHGQVGLSDVVTTDGRGRDLVAFDRLRLVLSDVQPLNRVAHLDTLEWEGLKTQLHRSAQGNLEFLQGWTQEAPSSGLKNPPESREPAPWAVTLRQASVRATSVDWIDASTGSTPARLALRNVHLAGSSFAWPLEQPVQVRGSLELQGDRAQREAARLAFSGEATRYRATAAASVRGFALEWATPYLKRVLLPNVRGVLDTDFGVAWNGPALAAKIARLTVSDVEVACAERQPCQSLQDTGVSAGGKGLWGQLHRLDVEDTLLELHQRRVTIGRMLLDRPQLTVARAKEGRWMVQDWVPVSPHVEPSTDRERHQQPPTSPWSVALNDVVVESGAVGLRDLAPTRPVAVNLSAIQIRAKDIRPLDSAAAPFPMTLSARVASGRTEPGQVNYRGTVAWAPVAVKGALEASRLPLHAFEPYVGDQLNVSVVRADGSFKGHVLYQATAEGARTAVQGDLALEDVRVRSRLLSEVNGRTPAGVRSGPGDELFNWKTLDLRGVSLASNPGQPLLVNVKETALADFFARIIVQQNGRINLQDIRKNASDAAVPESGHAPATTEDRQDAPSAAVSVTAKETEALAPVIRFGPVTLSGGAVRFTDQFVRPNYSADLSELAGRLGAFSSVPSPGGEPLMADLELRGRAEGTASLEVVGKLNPLAKPLALDIQGRMRDLELPPLSPYSVKYAGHGIERGKLSMDVRYRVLSDGQLTATNKLVLQQLAFGDPVDGAPASLPVRLAVALLADRDGVIDVDLPISGSLNDPEFRLGPVILRVIGNLVMKAVTAPFSLLAGAFGGTSEPSSVDFAPGDSELSVTARTGLDKIAQSLIDRPALKMTVVGEAKLAQEHDAWRKRRLLVQLQELKNRQTRRAGSSEHSDSAITAEEYPVLLKELYRRTDMGKPRNLVGWAKDLPDEEKEALLLSNIPVPEAAMRDLAVARGVAVRDYLAQRQVPLERLFVGAPRTGAEDDGWAPRATLILASR